MKGRPRIPEPQKMTRLYISLTNEQLERMGIEKVRELCRQIINKEYRKIK